MCRSFATCIPALAGAISLSSRGVPRYFFVRRRKLAAMTATLERFREPGVLFALAVIVTYLLGMQLNLSNGCTVDELHHYPQIRMFAEGEFDIYWKLAMLPGYHAIVAAMAWLVGDHSLAMVRALSQLLCFPAIILFFLCARELGKANRFSLSLLFFLSPLVFHFFFLIYTEIPSLLFLLGALLLTLKRRYQLAGLVVLLSLLLRQTNVVWALFYALIALGQEGVWGQLARRDWQPALRCFARLWLFVLAGFAFLAFVYWNGGVALGSSTGDLTIHELGRPYPTQVYLLLFTLFFLFLPLHIWNLPRIAAMIRRRPAMWLFIGVLFFVFYMATFWVDHAWNRGEESLFYLRNRVLLWMRQDLWFRMIAFIPMLWACFSLCATPLRHRYFYWLYPVAILAVLPHSFISPRYFIEPVTLFMLVHKLESAHLDRLTIAIYVPVTCYLYLGIGLSRFFI